MQGVGAFFTSLVAAVQQGILIPLLILMIVIGGMIRMSGNTKTGDAIMIAAVTGALLVALATPVGTTLAGFMRGGA